MRKLTLSGLIIVFFAIAFLPSTAFSAEETGNIIPRSDYFSPAVTGHYFWNGVYDFNLVHNQSKHTISNDTYYREAGAKSESGFFEWENGKEHKDTDTSSVGKSANSYINYNNYWVNGTYQRCTPL